MTGKMVLIKKVVLNKANQIYISLEIYGIPLSDVCDYYVSADTNNW